MTPLFLSGKAGKLPKYQAGDPFSERGYADNILIVIKPKDVHFLRDYF